MIKKLNANMSLEEFRNGYWYRKELEDFCKENSIPILNGKIEISENIERFLTKKTTKQKIIISKSKSPQKLPKSLNETMPSNYSSSELYREFFKKHIGNHFHFTAYMMRYRKNNPDISFQDFINEWTAEYERRKDSKYKPPIMKSTQYNQYVRDFFGANPDKSLQDCIKCWNWKKEQGSTKIYEQKDLKILLD